MLDSFVNKYRIKYKLWTQTLNKEKLEKMHYPGVSSATIIYHHKQ